VKSGFLVEKLKGDTETHRQHNHLVSVHFSLRKKRVGYRLCQCDIPCITTIQAKQTVRIYVSDRLFKKMDVYSGNVQD